MGRVSVVRGQQAVTLALAQWKHANTATLTLDEALELVRELQKAIAAPPAHLPNLL